MRVITWINWLDPDRSGPSDAPFRLIQSNLRPDRSPHRAAPLGGGGQLGRRLLPRLLQADQRPAHLDRLQHPVAPLLIGFGRNAAVRDAALALHDALTAAGVEVFLDDRDERPGVMFADLELIGIPHRVTIGDRGLKDGKVEYQTRGAAVAEPVSVAQDGIVEFLREKLGA